MDPRRTDPALAAELLDALDAIVWQADAASFRFSYVSGRAEPLLGYPVERWLAEPGFWEAHVPQAEREITSALFRAVAADGKERRCAHRMITASGAERWFRTTVRAVAPDQHGARRIAGVMLDVTERSGAEEEEERDRLLVAEREARVAAEQAVRAREEFLSIASHELRTPLTSLQLVIQSLLRGIREGRPAVPVHMLSTAELQMRRLKALIDQLLDVARIQSGQLTVELEEVDLAAEARAVVERLGPEIDGKAPVSLRADAPVVGLWDRSRIDQLLVNLLSNALKYGDGKPITVAVEQPAEGLCRVTVRDRGIGIAPERIGDVFRRFERAVSARHYSGLGLGLYIVHEIVKLHGGTITVESELGQGSTFTVELPAGDPHAPGADGGRGEESRK